HTCALSADGSTVAGGLPAFPTRRSSDLTAAGLPPGLTISSGGVISGTLDRSASQGGPNSDGVYSVVVTATDTQGATATQSFSWYVASAHACTPVTVRTRIPNTAGNKNVL